MTLARMMSAWPLRLRNMVSLLLLWNLWKRRNRKVFDNIIMTNLLSANEEMETMMKGIKHGACDYLVKPVHLNRLKNIWLHVVKKSKNDLRNYIGGAENDAPKTVKYSRKNKMDGYGAVPKKIWELMNVGGISREHVASHLQKYRLGLKRLSLATQQQSNPDWNYISMNELDGSPSAVGMHSLRHSHQSIQPMSSQRSLAIPLIRPAGHGGNLLAVQDVSKLTPSGNSYGNTSNGGLSSGEPLFPSPSGSFIGNVPNCMALDASTSLPYAISGNSFATTISNATQPLAAGLCNSSCSWNAEVAPVFPGRGHNRGISVVTLQGNGHKIDQPSKLGFSSGPVTAIGNEFQNQMATHIRTSAPVESFSEQIIPFNLGSNANSTSVPNDNSTLSTASSIRSALPNILIGNSDMHAQMLNGVGGSGNLLENDGPVHQQAFGDLMGTSEAQNQMSGDLDGFVADWLNRDRQNHNAAVDGDWQ
ncbi:hypothetical protein PR202_ga00706 [Eleusine coracana subsp. coracana]|uniref:Response regulatory domain-containing protein n=1 Tax=Eleusine coracana subsp. coracana TaxID=191504 RepID=A0AAV5BI68_ELECO|nr:hypothetical protein PR202_ga00706 [Eleusine coracana subsp. coracana]